MSNNAIAVRLDAEMQNRLRALSEIRDRSTHHLMKEAIAHYLQREEALETEKALMQERYAAYEATGEYVSHDDMKRWANALDANASAD